MYTLLLENYVEDDQALFRFAYSVKMLRWLDWDFLRDP